MVLSPLPRRVPGLPAWVAAVVCAAALTAVACHGSKGDPAGVQVTAATYVHRWDRSGLAPAAPGQAPTGARDAFVLKSNLGYEVRVDRGFLVDTSASLVDCLGEGGDLWKTRKAARAPGRAAAEALTLALGIGVAHAGHSQAPDPSSLARATLTDLTRADGERTVGETRFVEARYCRVHLVMAGGAAPSAYTATFPDLDTTRTSLYVRGAWRRPGTGHATWQPFELRSAAAEAVLLDLPAVVEGPIAGKTAVVVVERRLATLFDDVDLAALGAAPAPAVPAAKAVLRNLGRRARVRVLTR